MKKFMSILLAMLLCASMVVPAFAVEPLTLVQEYADATVSITVESSIRVQQMAINVVRDGEEQILIAYVFQIPESGSKVTFSAEGTYDGWLAVGGNGAYRLKDGVYTMYEDDYIGQMASLSKDEPVWSTEISPLVNELLVEADYANRKFIYEPGQKTDLIEIWMDGMPVNVLLTCGDLDKIPTLATGDDYKSETDTETEDSANPFTDVKEADYFYDAVLWAKEKGVTNGITATTFGPKDTCTRGQVVTFLWRAKGCPEPTTAENPFEDIKESDYYYKAVLWAVEQGITNGITATTFGPKDTCTNAHVVTFLWRAMGKPAAKSESALVESGKWYSDPVAWAEGEGLLSKSGVAFSVQENAVRADIVTYLYNCLAE